MRDLLLLRHAKSDWPLGVADIERPLADRGRVDAPQAGREIAAMVGVPDRVLVSPARRTIETWDLVATGVGMASTDATLEARIYEAEVADLRAVIDETPDDVSSLMIIGHNPGLETLAHLLAGAADDAALSAMSSKFPTSAIARFEWTGPWFAPESVRLVQFVVARG